MAVYKEFRIRPSEAWYQLSQAEKDSLFEKVNDARTQVGGKVVVSCNSGWASEQWQFFG